MVRHFGVVHRAEFSKKNSILRSKKYVRRPLTHLSAARSIARVAFCVFSQAGCVGQVTRTPRGQSVALAICKDLKGAIRALGFLLELKKPQSLRSVSRQPVHGEHDPKHEVSQARRSRQRVWPAADERGRLWDQGQNIVRQPGAHAAIFLSVLEPLASACRRLR